VNGSFDLYSFLCGPAFVFSLFVFTTGCLYRVVQLFHFTHKTNNGFRPILNPFENDRSILFHGKSGFRKILISLKLRLQRTIFWSHPVMGTISLIFHILLFVTPVFLSAHNILAEQYIGVSLFTFPDVLMDAFTVCVIVLCLFFIARRLFIRRVRKLTTMGDYFVLILIIMTFNSAFVTYHQFGNDGTSLFIHIITGEILIMAIPFTRLSHMVFFLFSRFFIGGEYNRKTGNRAWYKV